MKFSDAVASALPLFLATSLAAPHYDPLAGNEFMSGGTSSSPPSMDQNWKQVVGNISPPGNQNWKQVVDNLSPPPGNQNWKQVVSNTSSPPMNRNRKANLQGTADIDRSLISNAQVPPQSVSYRSRTQGVPPELAPQQSSCTLPYCSGEASFYYFKPGDIFYCDKAVGRKRDSNKDKIVALPGFPGLLNRSLCGHTIRLYWNGQWTDAIVGDRCPDVSCHTRNKRIDLSLSTYLSLGGIPKKGKLEGIKWKILPPA